MKSMNNGGHTPIAEAARTIRTSRRLVVLTGAGISKESGIPTFRDARDGLWAKYDPQQLATSAAFRRNPRLVWDWYQYRRELIAQARPNPGHYAIAELEKHLSHVVVITQNIDGLHHAAGSRDVIAMHGDIRQNKCFAHCRGEPTLINIDQLEWDREAGPPSCPYCGAYVRPNVVWFNESLPPDALERAFALSQTCDVMLIVGTSGVVVPVATLPHYARENGAVLIEVNPDTTPITDIATRHLAGPAGEILPELVAALVQDDHVSPDA
jgi:NAD-dependent deacetylase